MLKLLPQANQAQQGLAHARGKHLKRHQHADGERRAAGLRAVGRVHHQKRTEYQDGQRHRLLQRVGESAVGVGQLPRGETGSQVARQKLTITIFQHRFHLQAFHRLHPAHIFGHKGLGARAVQKLLVEARAEHRCDRQRQAGNQGHRRQRDHGELPRIPEHHRQKNQQKRAVEQQRHGSAGHKLAYVLNPLQACHQSAGRALFEVGQGQAQQVPKHVLPQHRIDTVAGMQHQVLAHPGHQRGKQHEHGKRHPHRPQGALGLVHHHLVDDHLSEKRRGQTDQLNRQAGQQHLAPDALVLQELRHKPAEPEPGPHQRLAFIIDHLRCGCGCHQQDAGLKTLREFRMRGDRRLLAARRKVQDTLGIGLEHQHRQQGRSRACRGACGRIGVRGSNGCRSRDARGITQKGHAWHGCRSIRNAIDGTGAHAQPGNREQQPGMVIGGRKRQFGQSGVVWQTQHLAQAAQQPGKVVLAQQLHLPANAPDSQARRAGATNISPH